MNKIEEKIEEILGRFITQKPKEEDGILELDVRTYAEELINLIQQQREEAYKKGKEDGVMGLLEYMTPHCTDSYMELIEEDAKEYFCQTKGGKK